MIVKRVHLGAVLRQLRQARGLKLIDIAYPAGTDAANLSRMERGKQGYSYEILAAIADTLGVTLSELFRQAESRAGLQLREEHSSYTTGQTKPLARLNRHYAQLPLATRELFDTLLDMSLSGSLSEEACLNIASLLQATSGVDTTEVKAKRPKRSSA